jgi:NHLM bacteriocin system ABC transporter peptidase/ATP-binding protein
VVVEGFAPGKVFLNDPAYGRKVITAEEFDQAFTGVVLFFEKTPAFRPGGQRFAILKSLGKRLKGNHSALIFAVLVTLSLALPNLIIPTFSRIYFDDFLVGGNTKWLHPLMIAMFLTIGFKALCTELQQRSLLRMETKLALSSSARYFWHVLRMPIEFFSQRSSGDISGRVQLNDRVASLLSGELANNVVNLMLLGFYAALMLQYDVVLTELSLAVSLLNLVALRYVSDRLVANSRLLLKARGRLTSATMAGLQIIETVKSTGSENDCFAQWANNQVKVVSAEQQRGTSSQLLSGVPTLLTGLNSIAILTLGGLRAMNGFLSIGMLLAFQELVHSFMEPVHKLVDLGVSFQEAQVSMARLDDAMNYPVAPHMRDVTLIAPPPPKYDKLQGEITAINLSFGYSRFDPPFIKDFNLHVKPGQRVALVGRSGSGKSTIARIISGLYEPWSGEIRFDDRLLREIPRSILSSSLAMVDQDIAVFEGTIRENLALWDTTVDERSLLSAAKDAAIHNHIAALSAGYDSPLEEDARNFSGGQRQRMEIARALVGNPSILILDEATSALDPHIEKAIDDHLRQRGCTCLIVAHRLSTIRDCDEIIVLDSGNIVQRGTHEEMINTRGPYKRLVLSE